MTTTPRTHAAIIAAGDRWTYELKEEMQAMERELAAANERIKRMEEAGDRLLWMAPPGLKGSKAICAKEAWLKAKEENP